MSINIKPMRMLSEEVLITLLRVHFDYNEYSDTNKNPRFTFSHEHLNYETEDLFNWLAKQNIITTGWTLSNLTNSTLRIALKYGFDTDKKTLKDKLLLQIPSIKRANKEKRAKLQEKLEQAINLYGNRNVLTKTELNRIEYEYKDYPEILSALRYFVNFNESQVENLPAFLKDYFDRYSRRGLIGQERYYKPEYYTKFVFESISEKIKDYGSTRIEIYGVESNLFLHSIGLLHYSGEIELHSILGLGEKSYFATITNKKIVEEKITGVLSKKILPHKPNWSDTFYKEDRKYIFGTIGYIEFDKPRRYPVNIRHIFFDCLFIAKGQPVSSTEIIAVIKSRWGEDKSDMNLPDNQTLYVVTSQINSDVLKKQSSKTIKKSMGNYIRIEGVGDPTSESQFQMIVDFDGNLH